MNFGMNHAPGEGSIAQPAHLQSRVLPLCYDCSLKEGGIWGRQRCPDETQYKEQYKDFMLHGLMLHPIDIVPFYERSDHNNNIIDILSFITRGIVPEPRGKG